MTTSEIPAHRSGEPRIALFRNNKDANSFQCGFDHDWNFSKSGPQEKQDAEINPHLTIGHELGGKFDQALIETRRKIEAGLPIKANAQNVWLMESENGTWTVRNKFPLLL